MALDDRTRSQVMVDASPLSSEQINEYASLNQYTRSWEIAREHVTIKQIVGKGAFGQVAKATAINLQGRAKKTLVAVKMLKGAKLYRIHVLLWKVLEVSSNCAVFFQTLCFVCKRIFVHIRQVAV